MRLSKKLRRWKNLHLMTRILHPREKWLAYAPVIQDYFSQQYNAKVDTEPFSHGMITFAVGYFVAMQIVDEYTRKADPDAGLTRITEPDYLEAVDRMDNGIREMSSSGRKMFKKEARLYCDILEEFSAFLDYAGAYEAALRCIEYRIEFGTKYAPRHTCSERLNKLNFIRALCLAQAGRYREAIQIYPSKDILHAIEVSSGRNSTPGAMIEMFQYVQAVIESALDPNGRCGPDDLEYANRWLSDFYLSVGSYADVVAINMEDIIGNKIGEKKNRNAVTAYLHFSIGAYHCGLIGFAKNSLSTACRMAVEVLDRRIDSEANLFYQVFLNYFRIYLFEPNLSEAGYVLEKALEFLNERLSIQRAEKGEHTAISLVDVEAKEQIMLCKSMLLYTQGNPMKALELSDWVASSHGERRQHRAEGCDNIFDSFYLEALSTNVLHKLQADQGRTPSSDARIKEMLQEIVHIAEDLKLITLDNARQDAICDMQPWANFIFSYWVEFPDHAISAVELCQFELNTKNIDPDIRFLQNRVLQSHRDPLSDVINQEQKNLWGNYQKAAFESSEFQTNQKRFLDQQIALDIKRYQLLKTNDYEFTNCDLRSLQQRLSGHRAVLEFRKFVNYHLFPNAPHPISGEPRYGAFLITGDRVDFKLLGSAEETEKAVAELLADIQDVNRLDSSAASSEKLRQVEDVLLGPFHEALVQMDELYIVPDDEIYKVPFELMPVWNEGRSQADSIGIKICYLTSARSILNDSRTKGSYRSIRVIADPQFKIENDGTESATRSNDIEAKFLKSVRSALSESGIAALKYTGLEAESIKKVFIANQGTAEIVKGKDAQKDNVFTSQTDILHFATHGFAISAQVNEDVQEEIMYPLRVKQIAASNDALLRCGLLLSGADNWLNGVEADGFGNGILTGMDILSENLAEYQLVVLSACGTGQGTAPYSGEGIEGLRSAFELAGVPILVCTLWEVDDFATALFMAEFYQELQHNGVPLSALYMAKRTLQGITYAELEHRGFQSQADSLFEEHMALSKEERPFAHPRYWAGFILHGAAFLE